jgi:hypothetical protein
LWCWIPPKAGLSLRGFPHHQGTSAWSREQADRLFAGSLGLVLHVIITATYPIANPGSRCASGAPPSRSALAPLHRLNVPRGSFPGLRSPGAACQVSSLPGTLGLHRFRLRLLARGTPAACAFRASSRYVTVIRKRST